ncbi:MAG: putative Fe-S cluster assembly protein SufT [Alphaproteobacteria bacterium]|nr:putative Fe-S cluster assembly protein SufT [Alphaproteobacteria bacterium]
MTGEGIITLKRDCDATLIPAGTRIELQAGTPVTVTQALGGTYTVAVHGNLARIDGKDADALGLETKEKVAPPEQAGNGTAADEEAIWEQLRTCYDPEIPVNIVDLGLIYDCKITTLETGGSRVDITMTLTAPGCGMGDILAEDVRQKLLGVPNVREANVEVVFDPPWDQSMMSEAAQLEVGLL